MKCGEETPKAYCRPGGNVMRRLARHVAFTIFALKTLESYCKYIT